MALAVAAPSLAETGVKRSAEFAGTTTALFDVEVAPEIIVRNDLDPNTLPPGGVLDSGISGVGQMTIRNTPTTTSMGVCTGTLINPRTVIFAAHCVNSRPAEAYGVDGVAFGAHSGGTPMAFGFSANNLPAVRQWLGLDGGAAGQTNLALALYAVEQVWYDPRSLNPASCTATACFLQADIAIATLDTPAFGIPTWAMLFSPLDGPTHAIITGYGNRGNESSAALAIDWRRRSAENMIGALGSLDDRNQWLFGPSGASPATNSLYLFDFSDPDRNYNPTLGRYDFGLYGSDPALPREGTTGGGDSGGPLIVDQKYDRPVTVGVLSGGTRFFAAQAGHKYGTDSFYQPLFLYWDVIVANNPYVYAGNKGGVGDWENPAHWVQLMDPNYMIDVNGQLVNALPDTPAQGVTAGGAKFGQLCFLTECTTLEGTAPSGDGTPIFVEGGPGSTNFVPNNRVANPSLGVNARYYDVTLSAPGRTSLSTAVTIDRMTMDGETRLHIGNIGSLNVLGEFNLLQGWANVDGSIHSGRDMMVLSGLLSGSGTINSPFLTVVGGYVAPGTITPSGVTTTGTLSVNGNMILASASTLMIELGRGKADLLDVSGVLALNGGTIAFGPATGAAVRHGQSYTIATAGGGVDGTFGTTASSLGVLNPNLTYSADSVSVLMEAGSLARHASSSNASVLAFADALDALRSTSYNQLFGLYGSVDLMGSMQLATTLQGLSPSIVGETQLLQDRQSRQLLGTISDRLSILGTGNAAGISFSGQPGALMAQDADRLTATSRLGLATAGDTSNIPLANGVSGFVSAGGDRVRSSYGDMRLSPGQENRYFASGMEVPLGKAMIGSAVGYAEAISSPGADQAKSKVMQAAAYATLPVGRDAYVAGIVVAERARSESYRVVTDMASQFRLTGATHSSRYGATAEAGIRQDIGRGLAINPRAQVGFSRYSLGGFRERGGETALALDDLTVSRIETRLGAKLDGKMELGDWTLRPQVQADYVALLSGANAGLKVRFAAAPEYAFGLPLTDGGNGWLEAKGGAELSRGPLTLGVSGQVNAGNAPITDTRGAIDMTLRF